MKPKHKMTVLHFKADYADEFDVEFIAWVDKQWWKQYKKDIYKNDMAIFPTECYFGTNECIEFDSADDFFGSFDEHEADDDQIKFLQRISGGTESIGTSFHFRDLLEEIEDY
jgi:hypothetical protein